ncbi:phosphocarrier protein HPr [Luminiphilus syltensis NOR5-1B]|uniref:Phosphocarrier protein HPr n=1 Tax=Luminiphilus syltensis NOR5-1B TaxID=565045 RepID=B8KR90_9GAMM|nr:HPr family phosphocarrier protein [Luminiphilus syltensis]EED34457.1 phosphocarrier protein HPr [Luminiphilus syltensis NOR5-1B]
MIETEIEIINKLGLHARAAAKLVDCAAHYSSRVMIGNSDKMVDAKSIMSVMMLAAGKGTRLQLHVDGRDEDAAAAAIIELIADRFTEAE